MNKQDYFEKSKKDKVSKKCPLYERCQRCALSLYLLSGLDQENYESVDSALKAEGLWELDENDQMITQVGSVVSKIGGRTSLYFENVCPEVPLFSNETFDYIPNKAITKGAWDSLSKADKQGVDGKFEILDTGHFTECREYIKYHNESKNYTKLSPPKQFVYLMRNNRSGYYKIGRSVNPKFRESTLQAQEPNVELLDTCIAPKELERELHQQYSNKRLRGEWFELDIDDVNKIITKFRQYS